MAIVSVSYTHLDVYKRQLYTDVIYVDSSATTGSNNGTSWANAFTDLQDALAVVRAGCVDTVKVAQGTYYPSDSTDLLDRCTGNVISTIAPDRTISFDIPDSAVVLGGYGHGADSVMRDWECNKTILCGDIEDVYKRQVQILVLLGLTHLQICKMRWL